MDKNVVRLMVVLLALSLLAGCAAYRGASSANGGLALQARSDDDYRKLGISRSRIEPWEDGMRTTGGKGSYEWWYFDSTLKDGSTLVIVFNTKSAIHPDTPLEPGVSIELNRPDGTSVHKELKVDARDFTAARDHCDVRIGANTFSGDLHDYAIHVDVDGVKADIRLHGTVPSWRPDTGHALFRDKDEHYYAWLPSVPEGDVEGTLGIEGKSQQVTGIGYHDHNWGDVSLLGLFHDWYWGRARIGSYCVIAAYNIATDKYGNTPLPVFMLARDGKIIADDETKMRFSTDKIYTDPYTGKPVASVLMYDYNDGTNRYRVTFRREKDLLRERFADKLRGFRYVLAKLAGFDGAYLRFTGEATLERFEGDRVVETVKEQAAVWELMYLGPVPKQ